MRKQLFISLFCCLWLTQLPAFAHKEWVHQHMVKESYLFLEQQIGTIPALRNAIWMNGRGPGDGSRPFNCDHPISIGAWREDSEDPVYGYASGNGFTPSITHFWDADDADENHESMWLNGIGSSKAPNAWEKARVYLYCQDRNGLHDITIPYVMPGEPMANYIITYNSLPELYKGYYYLEAKTAPNGTGRVNYYHYPMYSPTFGQPVALQILGRVAHLLGDMSVPAHAHCHAHPCPLGLPDFYENNMGNVYWSNNGVTVCEDDPGGSFRAEQWTAATAAQQGGLLQDMYCEANTKNKMKYLFYTVNQLADFFPSGVTLSQQADPTGPAFNNQIYMRGDATLGNGPTNGFLAGRYNALGGLPNDIDHVAIANETFNYSIRAVATLFQWFAFEADIIQDLRNQQLTTFGTQICQGTSLAFFAPTSAPVTWSVEPSSAATGVVVNRPFPRTPYYNVTGNAGYDGVATIKASYTVNDGCYSGPRTLRQQIWIGGPRADLKKQPATSLVCSGLTMYFEAGVDRPDLERSVSYRWSSTAPAFRDPGDTPACAINAPNGYDIPLTVTCVVTDNTCGLSTTIYREYTTANPNAVLRIPCDNDNPNGPYSGTGPVGLVSSGARLEVFPNPSDQSFEVIVTPAPTLRKAAPDVPTTVSYTLRDNLGRTMTSGTSPASRIRIDTRSLPAGVYSLSCTANGQTMHKRLEVLH